MILSSCAVAVMSSVICSCTVALHDEHSALLLAACLLSLLVTWPASSIVQLMPQMSCVLHSEPSIVQWSHSCVVHIVNRYSGMQVHMTMNCQTALYLCLCMGHYSCTSTLSESARFSTVLVLCCIRVYACPCQHVEVWQCT